MRLLPRKWSSQHQAYYKIYPESLSLEEASCAGIGGDNDQLRPCCTCWSLARRCSCWSSPLRSWSTSAWLHFGQRPHCHAWILQPFLSIWTSIDRWWTLFLWQRGIWIRTCCYRLISSRLHFLLTPPNFLQSLRSLIFHRLWRSQFISVYSLDWATLKPPVNNRQPRSSKQLYPYMQRRCACASNGFARHHRFHRFAHSLYRRAFELRSWAFLTAYSPCSRNWLSMALNSQSWLDQNGFWRRHLQLLVFWFV